MHVHVKYNATRRLGGHWTSRKAPTTDLELTHYRQSIPRGEKNKNIYKYLGHGTEKLQVPQNHTKTVPL